MTECTRKKTFCQVCGYRACMVANGSLILHSNPPLHTMSPEGQAAVLAIAEAAYRRMAPPLPPSEPNRPTACDLEGGG